MNYDVRNTIGSRQRLIQNDRDRTIFAFLVLCAKKRKQVSCMCLTASLTASARASDAMPPFPSSLRVNSTYQSSHSYLYCLLSMSYFAFGVCKGEGGIGTQMWPALRCELRLSALIFLRFFLLGLGGCGQSYYIGSYHL